MTAYYEEIRKEKMKSSRQNSVLDIFKSSSGPRASPPGLFYIGDDPDDAPTVRQKVPPP
jgi:hypothetical protein